MCPHSNVCYPDFRSSLSHSALRPGFFFTVLAYFYYLYIACLLLVYCVSRGAPCTFILYHPPSVTAMLPHCSYYTLLVS
jgi:hypothetical protein